MINKLSMHDAFYQWLESVRAGTPPAVRTFYDVRWPNDASCWVGGYHGDC